MAIDAREDLRGQMALAKSLGSDIGKAYKGYQKQISEQKIVEIMSSPDYDPATAEKQMMQVKGYAQTSAYEKFQMDQAQRQSAAQKAQAQQAKLNSMKLTEFHKAQSILASDSATPESKIWAAQAMEQNPVSQQVGEVQATEAAAANKAEQMAALPGAFDETIKGKPEQVRKEYKINDDDAYMADAYNAALAESIELGKQRGLDGETVTNSFNQWWDSKVEEERGQKYQKFGDRNTFGTGQVAETSQQVAPVQAQQTAQVTQQPQNKGQIFNAINKALPDLNIGEAYKANTADYNRLIEAVANGQITIEEATEMIRQSNG